MALRLEAQVTSRYSRTDRRQAFQAVSHVSLGQHPEGCRHDNSAISWECHTSLRLNSKHTQVKGFLLELVYCSDSFAANESGKTPSGTCSAHRFLLFPSHHMSHIGSKVKAKLSSDELQL